MFTTISASPHYLRGYKVNILTGSVIGKSANLSRLYFINSHTSKNVTLFQVRLGTIFLIQNQLELIHRIPDIAYTISFSSEVIEEVTTDFSLVLENKGEKYADVTINIYWDEYEEDELKI